MGDVFVAYIDFFTLIKSGHDVPASSLDLAARKERGKQAVMLTLDLERKMISLIGEKRKRQYAHHLIYGLMPLYIKFGKPWCAATEGNEHLHKEMKAYFKSLVTHRNQSGNDCAQMLKLHLAGKQLRIERAHRLPQSEYAAKAANAVLVLKTPVQKSRAAAGSSVETKGNRANKRYKADEKMAMVRAEVLGEQ